jgi:hypothetical protein
MECPLLRATDTCLCPGAGRGVACMVDAQDVTGLLPLAHAVPLDLRQDERPRMR